MFKVLSLLLIGGLSLLGFASFGSQGLTLPVPGYFLAPDTNGLIQVWQLPADGSASQMLTAAPASIVDYALAPDGTRLAYTSEQQLWLQPLDGSDPIALAALSTVEGSHPVFSPDGQMLAYADNGLWIMGVDGSDPRQLLANVPFDQNDGAAVRHYQPDQFVNANSLIVTIGVWEGVNAGLVDITSGDFQELPPMLHTGLLPLSDGRLLVYGNNGVFGEFNLQIADPADLTALETVLDFSSLTERVLFVERAYEIQPGLVRLVGTTLAPDSSDPTPYAFAFTFDLIDGELLGEIQFFPMTVVSASPITYLGALAPDGTLLVQYTNVYYDTALDPGGIITGSLNFHNLETGEQISYESLGPVSSFQWGA